MTPQERQLIDQLFDRLAGLERSPRDSEAGLAIARGLERAPNAVYALVQTVLVQDEALRRANDRIAELENGMAPSAASGGFLDSMRATLWGPNSARGSVPSVPPADPASATRGSVWNSGAPAAASPPSPFGGGSSFLGTAAAAAAGVIGGSLLLNGIRSMMGGSHAFAGADGFDADRGGARQPWNNDAGSGNLSRDAGLDDIGGHGGGRHSLFDSGDTSTGSDFDVSDDFGGDTDSV